MPCRSTSPTAVRRRSSRGWSTTPRRRRPSSLGGPGGPLDLVAADPGAWGANLRATVDHGGPVGSVSHTPDTNTFHLTIDEIDPEQLALTGNYERSVVARETHNSVSVVAGAERHVSAVLAASSRLVRADAVPGQRPDAVDRQSLRRRRRRRGHDGGGAVPGGGRPARARRHRQPRGRTATEQHPGHAARDLDHRRGVEPRAPRGAARRPALGVDPSRRRRRAHRRSTASAARTARSTSRASSPPIRCWATLLARSRRPARSPA